MPKSKAAFLIVLVQLLLTLGRKKEADFIDKQLDDDANGVKCPRTMSF